VTEDEEAKRFVSSKVGRNDPCPCGSGLKYKRCCLPKGEDRARFELQATRAEQLLERLHAVVLDMELEFATHRRNGETSGADSAGTWEDVHAMFESTFSVFPKFRLWYEDGGVFQEWLLFDSPLGPGLIDVLDRSAAADLTTEDRHLLRCWQDSVVSIFRVEAVDEWRHGHYELSLSDVLLGRSHTLLAPGEHPEAGSCLVGRLLPIDGHAIPGGMVVSVPGEIGRSTADMFRRMVLDGEKPDLQTMKKVGLAVYDGLARAELMSIDSGMVPLMVGGRMNVFASRISSREKEIGAPVPTREWLEFYYYRLWPDIRQPNLGHRTAREAMEGRPNAPDRWRVARLLSGIEGVSRAILAGSCRRDDPVAPVDPGPLRAELGAAAEAPYPGLEDWPFDSGPAQEVAELFAERSTEFLSREAIADGLLLWHDYVKEARSGADPLLFRNPGGPAGAIHYTLFWLRGMSRDGAGWTGPRTQGEIAGLYGSTAGTVSRYFQRYCDVLELDDRGYMYAPGRFGVLSLGLSLLLGMLEDRPAPVRRGSRMMAERELHRMHRLFESREFKSLDELNAAVAEYARARDLGEDLQGAASAEEDTDPRDRARDLIYDAWDCSDRRERLRLVREALSLDPDQPDAYNLLADEARLSSTKRRYYERALAAAESRLDQSRFEEDVGHFWGLLDTRPYMRARAGLADCLYMTGVVEEALQHYRDMLRLNPGDNQGIRYRLAICLLEQRRDREAAELLNRYDDATEDWLYNRALLEFRRRGRCSAANAALRRALDANPYVPGYLTGEEEIPDELPDYVTLGGESAAASYAEAAFDAWSDTPGALRWLAGMARRLRG